MDGRSRISLGRYKTDEYAAKTHDAAAWILFGASAHYNFPIGTPSGEHRQTARNYIERQLNIHREKELIKMQKKILSSRLIALPQVLV